VNEWQAHAAALVDDWRDRARRAGIEAEIAAETPARLLRQRVKTLLECAEELASLGTTGQHRHRHRAPVIGEDGWGSQTLEHAHPGGEIPHGYYGHPEDPAPHEPSDRTGTWEPVP